MTNIRDIPNPDTYGRCECCREEKRLTRHHVVPYAFSKHFPNKTYEDNKIMLCRDCHDLVEIYLLKFRRFFAGKLGITSDDLKQSELHVRYKKAKAYAWQLISNDTNIPADKIMEMTLYIHDLYPEAETRKDFIKIARSTEMIRKTRKNSYGQLVAERIQELGLEEWFWDRWVQKNRQVIKKIRAKGPKKEKIRRSNVKQTAPEAEKHVVCLMLVSVNRVSSIAEAQKYYDKAATDERLYLRRFAYNWAQQKTKESKKDTLATRQQTIEYMARTSKIDISVAKDVYNKMSKSRKKRWHMLSYVDIMKSAAKAAKSTEN